MMIICNTHQQSYVSTNLTISLYIKVKLCQTTNQASILEKQLHNKNSLPRAF